MKRFLLGIFLIIIINQTYGLNNNLQKIQSDSSHLFTFKPLIGLKIFNPYYINYLGTGFFKGIITTIPQFGVDIFLRNSKWGFSVRKEFFYVFSPDSRIHSDIIFKSEGWILEYKYTFKKSGILGDLQIGSGISFFDIQNQNEHFFGLNYPEIGTVFFISKPFKFIRVEARTDIQLSPILQFAPYNPFSLCLTYNFTQK